MKQDHKVMQENDICPKFERKCADLKCQAQYSAEHHLPWSDGHYGAGINKFFDEHWDSQIAIFLEESLEKVTFWDFEETTNLILVDSSWY